MKKKILVVSLMFFMAAYAMATDIYWDGGGADNYWNTAANWQGDTTPVLGDKALIPYIEGAAPIVNSDSSLYAMALGLTGDAGQTVFTINSGKSLSLSPNGYVHFGNDFDTDVVANIYGTLNTRSVLLGTKGKGTMNVDGGTINCTTSSGTPGFVMGQQVGHGTAIFTMTSGTINLNKGSSNNSKSFQIGAGGSTGLDSLSQVNISGGTLNMNDATSAYGEYLGVAYNENTDNAELNLSGTGVINMVSQVVDAREILLIGNGVNSSGVFNQTGGTVNIHNGGGGSAYISVAHGNGSTGVYNFSAGQCNTDAMNVGTYGQGTLNLSGSADLNLNKYIRMGAETSGGGIVNMTGGSITTGSYIAIGYSAASEFKISGGTLDIGSSLEVGRAAAGLFTITGNDATIKAKYLHLGGNGDGVNSTGTLKYKVEADGVSAIQITDSVLLDPGAELSMAILLVELAAAPPIGDILLIDNQGTADVSGLFDSLNGGSAAEGALVTLNFSGIDYHYTLTYKGTAGTDAIANDVMLLVPEPATIFVLGFGLLMLKARKH